MRQEKTVKPQNPKCDESGMGRDESGALGTNQRREAPLPDALARHRHRHAIKTALRDSFGLIGAAQKHDWAEHLAMPCPA